MAPPEGLVLGGSSTALRLRDGGQLLFRGPRLLGLRVLDRSSVKVHGSCDDRTNLYPAAPFRLANMLHAWTQRARGMGLIF
jgi:hypothetical protein